MNQAKKCILKDSWTTSKTGQNGGRLSKQIMDTLNPSTAGAEASFSQENETVSTRKKCQMGAFSWRLSKTSFSGQCSCGFQDTVLQQTSCRLRHWNTFGPSLNIQMWGATDLMPLDGERKKTYENCFLIGFRKSFCCFPWKWNRYKKGAANIVYAKIQYWLRLIFL